MTKKQRTTVKSKSATETGKAVKSTVKQDRQEIVRDLIKIAKDNIETGYIDLCKLLSEAYHRSFFEEWGFEDFEAYCQEELDIKYRKAMYFVEIWDKVKSLKLDKRKVARLGWTKMKEIASVITAETAKEWMEKASKMTSRELTEAVKIVRKRDVTGVDVPTVTTMTLRMSESEANIITEAIEEAKKLTENENAVIALEMICQDWLADKGSAPERTNIDDLVAYMEEVYEVKVTYKKAKKKKSVSKDKSEKVMEKVDGKEEADDLDIDDILDLD